MILFKIRLLTASYPFNIFFLDFASLQGLLRINLIGQHKEVDYLEEWF